MEEKEQCLEANIPTRLYCEVEQAQMERAIQNILVNATHYSPSGKLIRISLSETHGTIRGEIENTGVRVPDDSIPHLFEAFYRADTSRNRNSGGKRIRALYCWQNHGNAPSKVRHFKYKQWCTVLV